MTRSGRSAGSGTVSLRQRLVALSDADRSFTYEILPGSPIEVANYRGRLQVRPAVDSGRAFVEWTATVLRRGPVPTWLEALRTRLTG